MSGLSSLPQWTAKLRQWALVVGVCTLIGSGLGQLIDALLWEVSYDYVYPPHAAQAAGLRLGGWLGTLMAVVGVVGARPLLSLASLSQVGCLALGLCGVVTLGYAGTAWVVAKLGVATTGSLSLSRVALCTGLLRGSVAGALVAVLFWSVTVWYGRRRLVMITIPDGSSVSV